MNVSLILACSLLTVHQVEHLVSFSYTRSWVQVLGDFIIKQLSCERKSAPKHKLSQKLKVGQMQLSSNRWIASGRDVQQLRLAADFFKQFPSWIFRNLASFDVGLHRPNSDALNSICSISKSSISVLLKRSRSNWVVVVSSKSGLTGYENMSPWIWKSWLRRADCTLSASKLELEQVSEGHLSAL